MHGTNLAWWQIASGIVLLALIINGYIQKYRKSKSKTETITLQNKLDMEFQTITVEGMTCNHCKMNVENNLKKLDFLEDAQVNLTEKSVALKGDRIDLAKVKETVESLGYTFKG